METTEQRISSIAITFPDKFLNEKIESAQRENRIGLIGTLISAGIAIGAVVYAINSDTDTEKIVAIVPAVIGLGGVAVSLSRVEASGKFAIILNQELKNRNVETEE